MDNNLIDFVVSLEDTMEEVHGASMGTVACAIEPGKKSAVKDKNNPSTLLRDCLKLSIIDKMTQRDTYNFMVLHFPGEII